MPGFPRSGQSQGEELLRIGAKEVTATLCFWEDTCLLSHPTTITGAGKRIVLSICLANVYDAALCFLLNALVTLLIPNLVSLLLSLESSNHPYLITKIEKKKYISRSTRGKSKNRYPLHNGDIDASSQCPCPLQVISLA